jgi:hypothetical protein
MELSLAKQIVSEALNIAVSKGCFGLVEVSNIVKALEKLEETQDIQFGEITQE